jgi:CTP synthase (UTP-ammonia lyase)
MGRIFTIAVGIIGDYDPGFPPHRATEEALNHAASRLGMAVTVSWIATTDLDHDAGERLSGFAALWCAPGSPYRSMNGALTGIRIARESNRPFLGTCGGFQHAVIEYARHVLGFEDAQHAEYDPYASRLLVTSLSCSLVGQRMQVSVTPGSRAFAAYGRENVEEQYYCNFGLNPAYQGQLHEGGLRIVGVDQDGEARIVELPEQRFFIATLFVPQCTSSPEHPHPLILAYLDAAWHVTDSLSATAEVAR